jgi:hypothetical protein
MMRGWLASLWIRWSRYARMINMVMLLNCARTHSTYYLIFYTPLNSTFSCIVFHLSSYLFHKTLAMRPFVPHPLLITSLYQQVTPPYKSSSLIISCTFVLRPRMRWGAGCSVFKNLSLMFYLGNDEFYLWKYNRNLNM